MTLDESWEKYRTEFHPTAEGIDLQMVRHAYYLAVSRFMDDFVKQKGNVSFKLQVYLRTRRNEINHYMMGQPSWMKIT